MTDTPTLSPAAMERLDAARATYRIAVSALEVARSFEAMTNSAGMVPPRQERVQETEAALTATVAALVAEAEGRGREAAGLWRCECPMCLHHTEAHAINDPPPADFHGVTPTPHAAWCQSRFPMRGAPLPCNCAGHRDQGEGAE